MTEPANRRSSRGAAQLSRDAAAHWELDDAVEDASLTPRSDPPAGGVAYAEIPRRSVAFLLDLLIIQATASMVMQAAAFVAGYTILGTLPGGVQDQVFQSWLGFGLPTLVVGLLQAVVLVYFWRVYGASPGQLVMDLHTVRAADGARLSKRRAAVRWLLLFLPAFVISASSNLGVVWAFGLGSRADQPGATGFAISLPLVWFLVLLISSLFDARGRGLHDRAAGSVVVRREG